MSSSPEHRSPVKTGPDTRKILGPGGNRVRDSEQQQKKKMMKPELRRKKATASLTPVKTTLDVRSDVSVESSSSSDLWIVKAVSSNRGVETISSSVKKNAKVVPRGVEVGATETLSPVVQIPLKRCDWITPNSEPLYISFHDEEWGNPVYDDTKLYELLALSQALAEMTWPAILNKRHIFRKLFDNFDPSSLANVNEKRLRSLRESGNSLLSEPKIRAIVENAKHFQKIQQEFGSFSNYCWRFVNHKPIKSGFRYARQLPAKTPKSELMSKDLMKRGFVCVGPTVMYSFMQVAGIFNDHLVTCFRYNECKNNNVKEHSQTKLVKTETQVLDPVENNTHMSLT